MNAREGVMLKREIPIDELHSNSDSEGDGEKVRFPQFNMDRDIDDPTFKVGMVFSTRNEFKDACRAYGLSIVGIDPNDYMFPLAYAVMRVEDKDSWWIQGLVNVVSEMFPNSEHRLCVKHMYINFRGRFKGKELKDLVWNAARATYQAKLDFWLEKIENKSSEVRGG
ncbi:hypothetical protein GH714_029912 [Hevea brasiliensis]|uniref:MULE transposase domain-containing protein n=1 Tax=Hevea brasiliensis TaxID=3981 RepID=A0A6A6NDD0_HEVBR|nr:hypothetical protein GH714_029912 [Hevea brasiliensis]